MAQLYKLSRRDFLKASGLTAMSMAVAACAPAQVSTEAPSPMLTKPYRDCSKGIKDIPQINPQT